MKGQQFRVNKDFAFNCKDSDNKIIGCSILREGTILTVIDTEVRNGIKFSKLSHSVGWISGNNKIWNKLDIASRRISLDEYERD